MSDPKEEPSEQDIGLPTAVETDIAADGAEEVEEPDSATLADVSLDSPPRSPHPEEAGRKSSTYNAIDGHLSPPLGSSSSGFDLSNAAHEMPSSNPTRSGSPIRVAPGSPRTLTPRKQSLVDSRSPPASPSPSQRGKGRVEKETSNDIPLPSTPHLGDAHKEGSAPDTPSLPEGRQAPTSLRMEDVKLEVPNGGTEDADSPTEAFESVSLGEETPTDPTAGSEEGAPNDEGEAGDADATTNEAETEIKGDKTVVPPAGGEPVRRHAPPAHPHPYPLPSSAGPSSPRHSSSTSTPAPSSTIPSSTSPAPSTSASTTALPVVASVATVASVVGTSVSPAPSAVPAAPAAPSGGIGVKGPSAFEKVVSHTRPSHLPPKPKEEDESHYHQWEEMMSTAKEHEAAKRKRQAQALLEKERRMAGNTKRWDALLSDPTWSRDKVVVDQGLRQMWFDGIPGYLRGKAWALAIGNPLAMSKDAYRMYSSRAAKAYESGRFPKETEEQMEKEIDQVLPTLKLFIAGSPLRMELKELISSWVVYRSDDGLGYSSHIAYIAAMLLLTSPPAVAFVSMCNLLARPFLHAFFTDTKDEIDAYYRVFENLQADQFPKIYANCKNLGLRLPESYFRSLLVEQVPFEAACRLWDQIVLDGDGYIFRAALAVFGFLEPRLLYPDRDEIESVLEGRNHAILVITERERERAKLRGEAYEEELDGKLSVFGLNEAALFEWLETDQWKESRYERLVSREMPD